MPGSECQGAGAGPEGTHREGDQQADGDAGGNGNGGLPVVLRGEDVRVLQGAVGLGTRSVRGLNNDLGWLGYSGFKTV